MKKIENKILSILCFLFMTNSVIQSQLNEGGTPISYTNKKIKEISQLRFETMPSFDIHAMIKEDSLNQGKEKTSRFAKGFNVNYSIYNFGTWETLENGDKVWRLGIKSLGAKSINIIFTEYHVPEGAKVYIFSSKTNKYIGAFTSRNNSVNNVLATIPVEGDEIVLEYFEPKKVNFSGRLTIGKVSHDYRGVLEKSNDHSKVNNLNLLNDPTSCLRDINCPEGGYWQLEKNAICCLFVNGEVMGTGSLINNTSNDFTPYLLTAHHVICSNDQAQYLVAVFNYENTDCNGDDGSLQHSISGAVLISNGLQTDFSLLKLNSTPPANFEPYYLGWDKSGILPTDRVTCIDHPYGLAKKISVCDNTIYNRINYESFNCWYLGSICDLNSYKDCWHIFNWTSGVTRPVSSGAPIIDINGRIFGQLYGGYANCTYPTNDYFGRFDLSWIGADGEDDNTTIDDYERLSDWLDPDNLGSSTLDGLMGCLQSIPSGTTFSMSQTINTCKNIKLTLEDVTINNNANMIFYTYGNGITINGTFNAMLGTTLKIYKE